MEGFSGILTEAKLMWKLKRVGWRAEGSKAVNNLLQGLGEYERVSVLLAVAEEE